jgi:transcriptional/translational regulatory protein YebC/TACO1
METRKITVFDTLTSSKTEFQSSASTFGEAKAELRDINWDDKKVTVRESRVTLEADGAELPEGDIVLFLFKKKSKFGNDTARIVKRLRRIEKKLDDILEAIELGDEVNDNVKEDIKEVDEDIEKFLKEAKDIEDSI